MKKTLKKLLPEPLYRWLRYSRRAPPLVLSTFVDTRRYARSSSVLRQDDDEQKLRAIITATYHNIEKGLSLPNPRLGFGVANLSNLIALIDECLRRFGPRPYLATPISVLGAYVDFHDRSGCPAEAIRKDWLRLLALNEAADSPQLHGGLREVSREHLAKIVAPVAIEFFETRFSSRQFSDATVTREQIAAAVHVAQKAPVVCNRQSGRIRAYLDPTDIKRILELQGGARGFADGVKAVFCVSVDLRNFHGVGERYQGWIDGGLFAMSFLLGLHRQLIGTCCLNWSKDASQDAQMRALLELPPNELIVMFVAAGHLPDRFTVAKSVRKSPDEVLSFEALR